MTDAQDFADLITYLRLALEHPHPWFGIEPGHTMLISGALEHADAGGDDAADSIEARAMLDLCKCIRDDPRLTQFDNCRVALQVDRVHCTYFNLIEWLINRAGTMGPEHAVADLANYIAADELVYQVFYVLGAVEVASIIQITDRISLIPWTPPPRQRPASQAISHLMARLGWMCPAALVRRDTVPRRHIAGDAAPAHDPHFFDDLEDTLHCMTIAGPSGAYVAGVYVTFDASLPLPPPSIAYLEPEVRGARRELFPTHSSDELRDLFPLFRALPSNARQSLLLPISRMNLGMRRQRLLDTAIELRIAMESFFLHDPSKRRIRGRITERLVARAAGLLGTDAAERAQVADLFARTYDVSSEAVHRASFDDLSAAQQAKVKPTLDGAYERTASALRVAVRKTNHFDWPAIEQTALSEARAAIKAL